MIRAYPNAVEVPRHWKLRRSYLKNKRGVDKIPYTLPRYVAETGISEMRDVSGTAPEQSVGSKMRDRTTGRINRLVMDFQTCHDAFYVFQEKPTHLSKFGDLYFEGKEFQDAKISKKFVPGFLSSKLRHALGMEVNSAPPWLIQMQRYGPPPSYPDLLIPGLNCPLPQGINWNTNGWGKCPVDRNGLPLYGDVFGTGMWSNSTPSSTSALDSNSTPQQLEIISAHESDLPVPIRRARKFRDPSSWQSFMWGRMSENQIGSS